MATNLKKPAYDPAYGVRKARVLKKAPLKEVALFEAWLQSLQSANAQGSVQQLEVQKGEVQSDVPNVSKMQMDKMLGAFDALCQVAGKINAKNPHRFVQQMQEQLGMHIQWLQGVALPASQAQQVYERYINSISKGWGQMDESHKDAAAVEQYAKLIQPLLYGIEPVRWSVLLQGKSKASSAVGVLVYENVQRLMQQQQAEQNKLPVDEPGAQQLWSAQRVLHVLESLQRKERQVLYGLPNTKKADFEKLQALAGASISQTLWDKTLISAKALIKKGAFGMLMAQLGGEKVWQQSAAVQKQLGQQVLKTCTAVWGFNADLLEQGHEYHQTMKEQLDQNQKLKNTPSDMIDQAAKVNKAYASFEPKCIPLENSWRVRGWRTHGQMLAQQHYEVEHEMPKAARQLLQWYETKVGVDPDPFLMGHYVWWVQLLLTDQMPAKTVQEDKEYMQLVKQVQLRLEHIGQWLNAPGTTQQQKDQQAQLRYILPQCLNLSAQYPNYHKELMSWLTKYKAKDAVIIQSYVQRMGLTDRAQVDVIQKAIASASAGMFILGQWSQKMECFGNEQYTPLSAKKQGHWEQSISRWSPVYDGVHVDSDVRSKIVSKQQPLEHMQMDLKAVQWIGVCQMARQCMQCIVADPKAFWATHIKVPGSVPLKVDTEDVRLHAASAGKDIHTLSWSDGPQHYTLEHGLKMLIHTLSKQGEVLKVPCIASDVAALCACMYVSVEHAMDGQSAGAKVQMQKQFKECVLKIKGLKGNAVFESAWEQQVLEQTLRMQMPQAAAQTVVPKKAMRL